MCRSFRNACCAELSRATWPEVCHTYHQTYLYFRYVYIFARIYPNTSLLWIIAPHALSDILFSKYVYNFTHKHLHTHLHKSLLSELAYKSYWAATTNRVRVPCVLICVGAYLCVFVGISKYYGVSVRDSASLCEFVDVSVYSGVSEYISVDSCVFVGISMCSVVSVCICAYSCDFVCVMRAYQQIPKSLQEKSPLFVGLFCKRGSFAKEK